MATALQTIGKFTIKKKSGDKETIFGRYDQTVCLAKASKCVHILCKKAIITHAVITVPLPLAWAQGVVASLKATFFYLQTCSVTPQEVVDAIEAQTTRKLDKRLLDLPDIKKLGVYEATIRLHPNVTGRFKVVIQKEKEQR